MHRLEGDNDDEALLVEASWEAPVQEEDAAASPAAAVCEWHPDGHSEAPEPGGPGGRRRVQHDDRRAAAVLDHRQPAQQQRLARLQLDRRRAQRLLRVQQSCSAVAAGTVGVQQSHNAVALCGDAVMQ